MDPTETQVCCILTACSMKWVVFVKLGNVDVGNDEGLSPAP